MVVAYFLGHPVDPPLQVIGWEVHTQQLIFIGVKILPAPLVAVMIQAPFMFMQFRYLNLILNIYTQLLFTRNR